MCIREKRNGEIQFIYIIINNLEHVGISKILFKTSIKLRSTVPKVIHFIKFRKVVKNGTERTQK